MEIKDLRQGPSLRELPELGELASYGRALRGPRSQLTGLRAEIDRDDVRLISARSRRNQTTTSRLDDRRRVNVRTLGTGLPRSSTKR